MSSSCSITGGLRNKAQAMLDSGMTPEEINKAFGEKVVHVSFPEKSALPIAATILESDKAEQVFKSLVKNNVKGDAFWNKLSTDLQIPKEQINILKGFNTYDKDELLTNLLANYSYTVKVDTARKPNKMVGAMTEFYFGDTNYEMVNGRDGFTYYKSNKDVSEQKISEEEFNDAMNKALMVDASPTQHYSSMTVPGGTNYTENEIATPEIVPSIKGHAQFATQNGIGWTRTDERVFHVDDHFIIEELKKSGLLKIEC